MAKSSGDFLGGYSPERASGSRATNGGQCEPKPLPYSPPVGPKGQSNNSAGLGGEVYPCGTQNCKK